MAEGFVYASDNNSEWMADQELRDWIDRNYSEIGKI